MTVRKNTLGVVSVALAASLALSACNTVGPGQAIGTGTGAVLGGLVGSQIGEGAGNVAATVGLAAVGALLGGAIGANIDDADRQRAAAAQLRAVSDGRTVNWRGEESDVYGSVEPGEVYASRRGRCREYTHTIFINSRPQTGVGTACQGPDGRWEIVS